MSVVRVIYSKVLAKVTDSPVGQLVCGLFLVLVVIMIYGTARQTDNVATQWLAPG